MKNINSPGSFNRYLVIFIGLLLAFPISSLARGHKGISVEIYTNKELVAGELLEVRNDCLLVRRKYSEHLTGKKIEFSQIDRILIKRRFSTAGGILLGCLLGGATGAIIGEKTAVCSCEEFGKMMTTGLIGGLWGGVIGGGLSMIGDKYKDIYDRRYDGERLAEVVKKLNQRSRYHNTNLKLRL